MMESDADRGIQPLQLIDNSRAPTAIKQVGLPNGWGATRPRGRDGAQRLIKLEMTVHDWNTAEIRDVRVIKG